MKPCLAPKRDRAGSLVSFALVAAVSAGLTVVVVGCSGSVAQTTARDQATARGCSYFAKCNQIGPGKTYTSEDDCDVKVRAYFNDQWPASECTNIQSGDLDACLAAIDNTSCDNGLDFFNTVVNKCGKSAVCRT